MKQQIKAMLDDDRGVSPVIGVILMVAITVILAAVIGTFVLGLGDSLNQTPQAQIGADEVNGDIEISHNGGDALPHSDLELRLDSGAGSDTIQDPSLGSGSSFTVGESATYTDTQSAIASGNDVTVTLVHVPSDSILVETVVTIP